MPPLVSRKIVSRETFRARSGREGHVAFAISFVAFLLVAVISDPVPFQYDASSYWTLADRFVEDGSWSFLNFDSELRGFVPALLFGGLRSVAGAFDSNGSGVVAVFNSALFAAISSVLLPAFARSVWPDLRLGIVRRLGLAGLFLIFWRGYLNYPLTDFAALAAVLVALIFAARGTWRHYILSGLAAGVAFNLRPAFILLPLALLALALWRSRTPSTRVPGIHRAAAVVALVAGLACTLVPQAVVTHRHFDSWSPVAGSQIDLTGFQLTAGLSLQRYETFVGEGRPPQLNYIDPDTEEIRTGLGTEGVTGYGDYLGIAVDHPITISGVFVRHVANAMDQRYSTPYTEELDSGSHWPMRVAGFLLFFAAALRLAWPRARRTLGAANWRILVAFAGLSTTVLPSAVETRFFLPMYALAGVLVLAPGWAMGAEVLRRGSAGTRRDLRVPAVITLSFVAYMAVMWSIVSAASDNLQ